MRILLACAIGLLASPALAQARNCIPRDVFLQRLTDQFGESRQAIGIVDVDSAPGPVMEIYASNETGTWTITVTLPNGMMCAVGSGQSFETLNEQIALGDPT